jgi:choline dehydrogenase-like flavoprotein
VLPYNDLVEIHQRPAVKVIEERGILANDPLFLSFHPQGTLAMGRDPRESVVDSFGGAHGIKGLYVADASVFPTSVAVPPQITVMALATRTAERILHG